ncbi:MAG: SDR family NAD(P)-dependent oxidoreductase [Crocinitomicaceae bacterium]|nr:SDR family NAD(P)-dependent oxidoreductase [Crocinitomicaceae bacterium]
MSTVTIIGCGWLGLPLGKVLAAREYSVKGTTTTPEKITVLAEAGILPYLANFNNDISESTWMHITHSEEIVVTLPYSAKKSGTENILLFSRLAKTLAFEEIQRVVLISSTSVYPYYLPLCSEEDADPQHPLVQCERIFLEAIPSCCILRFGGLIGPGRHPGKFFSGKKNISSPDAPVNLIHLNDCIEIIIEVLDRKSEGVFNACAPSHPTRGEFYTTASKSLGLEPPVFSTENNGMGRTVSCNRLNDELGYVFKHEDVFEALKFC